MKHIIHFTDKFEVLKKILHSSSLRLHYCKEDFFLRSKNISKAAHPMVSFSEYNIKTINKKTITYGKFAIAFTKQWVEMKKLHPVLYIERNSTVVSHLANLLITRKSTAKVKLASNIKLSIMMLKCFTKNTKGYNSKLKKKDFNFKGENEWRYVPEKRQIGGGFISVNQKSYLEKGEDFYNDKLLDYPLAFTKDDIEYIFVETKAQKLEIEKAFLIDINKIEISRWATTKI